MSASFPSSVKSFTTKTNNVDTVDASHINDLQDEVAAIETALGADLANMGVNKLHLREVYASGTSAAKVGGGNSTGSWTLDQRVLNTVVTNTITGASLSSSIITLPAGTYKVYARVPLYDNSKHQAVLYNEDDTDNELIGQVGGQVPSAGHSFSVIRGEFTITAETDFSLKHAIASNNMVLGSASSSGLGEIFAEIIFEQIG